MTRTITLGIVAQCIVGHNRPKEQDCYVELYALGSFLARPRMTVFEEKDCHYEERLCRDVRISFGAVQW